MPPFTPREEGLRRGFAALDKEHTGKIPVDKFKRRLRQVIKFISMNQIHNTSANTNTNTREENMYTDNIYKCVETHFVRKGM